MLAAAHVWAIVGVDRTRDRCKIVGLLAAVSVRARIRELASEIIHCSERFPPISLFFFSLSLSLARSLARSLCLSKSVLNFITCARDAPANVEPLE